VRVAVLRSMKRALYSPELSQGHFGLAKKYYAHFTSPIRRYPDLTVHRQLKALLASQQTRIGGYGGVRHVPYNKEQLDAVSRHCCVTEQNADDAERALLEIKKYRLLEAECAAGQAPVREAVVAGVTRFGCFVELTDLHIQGLLRDARPRPARQHDSRRRGRTRKDTVNAPLTVGAKVRVRVTGADYDRRRVDFERA